MAISKWQETCARIDFDLVLDFGICWIVGVLDRSWAVQSH